MTHCGRSRYGHIAGRSSVKVGQKVIIALQLGRNLAIIVYSAVLAWRCWAWSLLMTSLLLSMFSNSWRPVHRWIMHYECWVAMDWIMRLCSMSIVPPSLLVWHTQPVHGVASSRHPIVSASIQWWTMPNALDTARQIHQLLRNCATLQTMICSEKLCGPQTICCTHYFHSLLLYHNITTSDIVPTHCSYLNI